MTSQIRDDARCWACGRDTNRGICPYPHPDWQTNPRGMLVKAIRDGWIEQMPIAAVPSEDMRDERPRLSTEQARLASLERGRRYRERKRRERTVLLDWDALIELTRRVALGVG